MKKILGIANIILLLGAMYWYNFIALDEVPMRQAEILQKYQYQPSENVEINLAKINSNLFTFTYESFDGDIVNGQISYPKTKADKYPVLISISAMGRSYVR